MKTSKYILVLIVICLLGAFFLGVSIFNNPSSGVAVNPPTGNSSKPIELCFAKFGTPNVRGYADEYTLRMSLNNEKVTGELNLLPAEKDKKIGKFEGTVSAVDKVMMARTADLNWNSMAEGMQVQEQLRIIFGEGTAQVGFGEMVDKGDGTYVYKDIKNITYGVSMSDVACSDLDERAEVSAYVRDNIKNIITQPAALGGSWYVTNINIDMQSNTGSVVYEDGHIQGQDTFSYSLDNDQVQVWGLSGRYCYEYKHVATTLEPYNVNEKIDITKTIAKVSGVKSGTQSGPDMTNGYTGTLTGTLDKGMLTALFSYVVEGAAQKEKEIYSMQKDSLIKHRYVLVEDKGVLVPDMNSTPKDLIYNKVSCAAL